MILALDTSTAAMSLALLTSSDDRGGAAGTVIAERTRLAERNHSILLVSQIQEMIEEAGVSMEQLKAVAVGHGPGSYTGVRIGVTVAKTLSWSLGIPLIGISSLEALALGAERDERSDNFKSWIVPLFDARRKNAYTALFAASEGSWTRLAEDKKRSVTEWLNELESRSSSEHIDHLCIAGDTEPFKDELAAWADMQNVTVQSLTVDARHIGRLGAERLLRGEQADVHSFVPNYTQLAEVESKYVTQAKQKDRSV